MLKGCSTARRPKPGAGNAAPGEIPMPSAPLPDIDIYSQKSAPVNRIDKKESELPVAKKTLL